MEFSAFLSIVSEAKVKKPVLFALETDPPATEVDISGAEARLSVQFPLEYKDFLRRFGGGFFGFTNVFSVLASSPWYVVDRNFASGVPLQEFLAISDNGVGDYYGFSVANAVCGSHVAFLDHETRAVVSTPHSDLFEYLVVVGLEPR